MSRHENEQPKKWLAELEPYEPRVKRTKQQKLETRRIRERGQKSTVESRARNSANKYSKTLKGDKCELCGSTTNLEMHHPDYAERYEINTLCQNCHNSVERATLFLIKYFSNTKLVDCSKSVNARIGQTVKGASRTTTKNRYCSQEESSNKYCHSNTNC